MTHSISTKNDLLQEKERGIVERVKRDEMSHMYRSRMQV